MRAVLRKELNQTIAEPESPKALLSGSDVFFTGREFFVGLSNHTNTDGAMAVATTWPEYPCTPIKVCVHFPWNPLLLPRVIAFRRVRLYASFELQMI